MPLVPNSPAGARYGATLIATHILGSERPSGGERFESRNPANLDDLVGTFPLGGAAEVEAACAAARAAFASWSATPAPVRGALLGRLARILEDRKEFLSRLVTREIGKPLREARGSVQEAIDTAVFFQSEGRRLYGQTVPSELPRKSLQTYRRPLGVCAMITAGNFPIAVPSWKIIPALICGNTVVWKPSEDASAVAHAFAMCLLEAGLPPGVLNVVYGTGAGAGAAVVDAIDRGWIDKVSFTGSTAIGRKIGEVAGRNLQVPSLELGGKNPMIVMADADVDAAVEAAIWAAYGTAGQRCTSLGNLILHEPIADAFVERFVARARRLRIGDPSLDENVDYGPMIGQRFLDRFLAHPGLGKGESARAVLEGGRIASSDVPNFGGDAARGLYVLPYAWDGVAIGDELAQTEVFGPTVNILRAANFDDAMNMANGTPYGLSSAIFTGDPVARLRFREEIRAGMSSINNSTTGAEAHLPFGGTKGSGNNTRESGVWVLDAYTRWHAVNIDDSGGLQLAQMDTEELAGGTAEDISGLVARR